MLDQNVYLAKNRLRAQRLGKARPKVQCLQDPSRRGDGRLDALRDHTEG